MQTPACKRQYVLLQGPGSAAGIARVEQQGGRAGVNIRGTCLPEEPLRALLMAGGGAVVDLGLVHRGALSWQGSFLRGGYHTLALVTDWPQARLVLWGYLKPWPGRTPESLQETAARYLRFPAPNSGPAPLELPEFRPHRSVLMLRHP